MTGPEVLSDGKQQPAMERRYQYAAIIPEDEEVTRSTICSHIARHTSAHGMPHVTKAKGSIKKGYWLLLSGVFLVALTYNIYAITSLYFSYPISIVISLVHEEELEFPAVTVCNMSPVRRSLWDAYTTYNASKAVSTAPSTADVTSFNMDITTESLADVITTATPNVTSSMKRKRRRKRAATQLGCADGWTEVSEKCLQAVSSVTARASWTDAREACRTLGGDLATIEDAATQNMAVSIATGLSHWTGLYLRTGSTNWGWVDGIAATSWTNWDSGEPNRSGDCVRVSAGNSYLWKDMDCSRTTYKAACSIDATGACPDYWKDSGVRCYNVSSTTGSTADAGNYCQGQHPSAKLAKIDAVTEHTFLVTNVFDGSSSYWIGLQKAVATLTWTDGSDVIYQKWASGEPSGVTGSGTSCMAVKADGKWEIIDCSTMNRYLCQTDMINITMEFSTVANMINITEVTPTVAGDTCSCCCGNQFVYTPPEQNDNETIPVVALEEEPKYVEESKFKDKLVLREDFQGGEDMIEALAVTRDTRGFSKKALGYSLRELVIDCQYQGADCSYSDFAWFHNPVHGNCYTFNSGWNNTVVRRSRQTGRRHGLHLTFNLDQDDYSRDSGDTAGVRLVVHPGDRMAFPEDEGITVGPGGVTYIGMTQVNIRRQNGPYGVCVDTEDSNKDKNIYENHYEVKYSVMACQKSCIQKTIVQECQCADAYYPISGVDVPICSTRNLTQDDCRFGVTRKFEYKQISCDCPNPCTGTIYSTDLSTGQWPSDVQRDEIISRLAPLIPNLLNDPSDPYKYQRNLLKMEIYYKEFNLETIKEQPSYYGGNFASDLGGVVGLWFGLSLLTIFEFVEFFMDMCVFGVSKCQTDKGTDKDAGLSPRGARYSLGNVELKQGSLQALRQKADGVLNGHARLENATETKAKVNSNNKPRRGNAGKRLRNNSVDKGKRQAGKAGKAGGDVKADEQLPSAGPQHAVGSSDAKAVATAPAHLSQADRSMTPVH